MPAAGRSHWIGDARSATPPPMPRFVSMWLVWVGVAMALGAGCGPMATATVTPVLQTIAVTPGTPAIAPGTTQQLAATGTYSDGGTRDLTSEVNWASSAIVVATVDGSGLVHALTSGTSTIGATFQGVTTSTLVTVTAAQLTAITVTSPLLTFPKGVSKQLVAMGTFSDHSQRDISTMVEWTSSNANVSVTAEGLATGAAIGSADVTATVATITSSISLAITAAELTAVAITTQAPHVPLGTQMQLTASGTYTDASTADLTTLVAWSSAATTTATITSDGKTTALAIGTSLITATLGAFTATTTLTVTTAALVSIAVTPNPATVVPGATTAMVATGTYSDATTQDVTQTAAWMSTTPTIATVASAGTRGVVTGVAVGSSTITATIGAKSGTATATVLRLAVTSVAPPAGSTGVRTTTPIVITFDQAALGTSLTGQTANGACSGSIQLSTDNFATCIGFATATATLDATATIASITPLALSPLTAYRIRVTTAAQNAGGDAMAADYTQATGFWTATDGSCASTIVISQVYSNGGNAGAALNADFIELHNAGAVAESLAGLSIQYAAATSATWTAVALPPSALPAGGYYLIQTTAAGTTGAALPTPDLVLASSINLSGTAGKVALVGSTKPLAGTCPLAATLDFVGYGTTANCSESANVATISATTSAQRSLAGCTDENDNSTDFMAKPVDATTPRSSATASNTCSCAANETDTVAEIDYCILQSPATLALAGGDSATVYGRVFESFVTEAAGADPRITMQLGLGAVGSDPRTTAWTWVATAFNIQVGNNDEYDGVLVAPAMATTYSYTMRVTRDGTNWTYCDLDAAGSNSGFDFSTAQLGGLTVN